MIGPNDVKPSSGKLLLYGVGKRLLFHPPGGKNFVHIHDVCRGIINAIDKGKTGDCYLLAGQNLSYREFFRLVDDAQHRKTLLIRIPPLVLKIAGMAGSALAKLSGRSPRLNYTSAYLLCLQNYYTGRKSERELQLRYTPIKTAVHEAFSWFRENAYF
jgi:dihydroflavonol-4-reductase